MTRFYFLQINIINIYILVLIIQHQWIIEKKERDYVIYNIIIQRGTFSLDIYVYRTTLMVYKSKYFT